MAHSSEQLVASKSTASVCNTEVLVKESFISTKICWYCNHCCGYNKWLVSKML